MEATKGEMQKTFEKHGKLTDVYMGQKVGKNGKYYAFIRYRGVTNAKELERKLDGAKIRGRILAVNIALRERKEPPKFQAYKAIVGEAMSLDHLGHLPKLLNSNDESNMEIKYIGGLRVLMLFDHSVAAKEFMENKCRIIGLPLHLWGQSNFEIITSAYGKTIAPFKDIPHRVDLSHVKIGILTKRKIRINEEVTATFEGKEYRLGIIEFDVDWFPFRFDPSEDYLEKNSHEKNDDPEEEEVKTAVGENKREEGEIWPELQNSSEENRIQVDDQGHTEMVDEQMHGEQTGLLGISKGAPEPILQILEALITNGNNQGHVTKVGISLPLADGAHNGLPPINCYGPFPYQLKTYKVAQTFRTGGSNGKRRRVMKLNMGYNTPVIPLMENPMESDPEPIPQTVPIPDSPPVSNQNGDIDLNTPPPQQNENREENIGNPRTSEMEETAALGRELGFDIGLNNPILSEVMGEEGENIPPQ
ncbi:unnamed protein product [Lactuca saligna]|uniref:RRM domain-containing protein n=1 Tax=Lactuca saligna TaxID=75948 RepID=A0AA36DVH6_LACSI|nr:unnamed protein product [Lactuca saligna]